MSDLSTSAAVLPALYPCDLHTHTTRSDGHLSPAASIRRAALAGLKVMAITDHDVILPEVCKENKVDIRPEDLARSLGVELLRGIEISCDTLNDDCHLIALYCEWDHPWFQELEKSVKESRTNAYKELVRRLDQDGYAMTWEEITVDCHKEETPDSLQKKQIYEFMVHKGYFKDWNDAKNMVLASSRLSIPREKPDPFQVIEQIHALGGLVIQAHPFLIRETPVRNGRTMTRFAYLDELAEAGLDGIEASYPYDKASYKGPLTRREIEEQVRSHFKDSSLFFSGGSDFHADYLKSPAPSRQLGEGGISLSDFNRYIRR